MILRTRYKIILLLIFSTAVSLYSATVKVSIALQPFSDFDTSLIPEIHKSISDFYGISNITVLQPVELPVMAWYSPRSRYRAEKLLTFLNTLRNRSCTKIIGLTSRDISTTNGKYVDWGIFGLGQLGGSSCVVSYFRLKKDAPNHALFLRRLLEVINHELGHTLGLDHCPHKGCIMEDAKGTIITVDTSSGKLCDECKKVLHLYLKMY